ncbi:MAG: hypothetical protein ABR880_23220 [Candidatus Sulfotelmatobacter sp.]
MRGTAKDKLAAFDSELARQLEQRKITLPAAKSIRIRARIGGLGHPESGTGSAAQDGKAAPQPGAANTQPHD